MLGGYNGYEGYPLKPPQSRVGAGLFFLEVMGDSVDARGPHFGSMTSIIERRHLALSMLGEVPFMLDN